MSSSHSNHSHRPTHNKHFLTMSWAPCIGTSQPVRRDDSRFTGGETAAQTSPVVGLGTHLVSAGAEFRPCLPGVQPLLINRIIAVTVQGWRAASWRDASRHLTIDTHLPVFPKRRNEDTFLALISHHHGLQAELCSFPSNIPRLFPPQGTVPPLTEMCLFLLGLLTNS